LKITVLAVLLHELKFGEAGREFGEFSANIHPEHSNIPDSVNSE
jgi:hypothetical protein